MSKRLLSHIALFSLAASALLVLFVLAFLVGTEAYRYAEYHRGAWDTCLYGSDNDLALCAHFLSGVVSNDWYTISRGTDQFEMVWPVEAAPTPLASSQ